MLGFYHFLEAADTGISCVQRDGRAAVRRTGRRGCILDLNFYTHDDISLDLLFGTAI